MNDITEARRHLQRVVVCASLAFTLAACDMPFATEESEEELFFFTQSATPDVVMDALFTGRVVRGEEGCLRLDSPTGPTVIWPAGYSLDGRTVRDAFGDVGSIGGTFRLGGGEVPSLHDGIRVTANTRQRAEAQCPGKYWIAADG